MSNTSFIGCVSKAILPVEAAENVSCIFNVLVADGIIWFAVTSLQTAFFNLDKCNSCFLALTKIFVMSLYELTHLLLTMNFSNSGVSTSFLILSRLNGGLYFYCGNVNITLHTHFYQAHKEQEHVVSSPISIFYSIFLE